MNTLNKILYSPDFPLYFCAGLIILYLVSKTNVNSKLFLISFTVLAVVAYFIFTGVHEGIDD